MCFSPNVNVRNLIYLIPHPQALKHLPHWHSFRILSDNITLISSLYDSMVNIKLKYNFVETPREFIIVELSIRKLGSLSVHYY